MAQKTLSSSLEDYLEAIYHISKEQNAAHANEIAKYLQVGKSSVSWALDRLARKGLINYSPYEAVTITEKGRPLAERVARRHAELSSFLTDVLGIDQQLAEENACRMEHVVDRQILLRMKQFMDYLQRCPRAGRQWMQAFGHFCHQAEGRDADPQDLTNCDDRPPNDLLEDTASGAAEQLPKTSKERDKRTLQRLRDVLAESGREFSPEQALVADVFMAAEAHQTIASVHQRLCQAGHRIGKRCVESTMEVLCEHKIAKPLRFDDRVVYEHYHPESHHDHLFCVKCGTIVEFFDPRIEDLQTDNAARADFRLLLHNLNIYGVCHDCIKRESQTRSLAQCLAAERVRVVRIQADSQTQVRISDMGLRPGSIVQMLSDDCFGGNVIALVGETRVMLDRDIAEKVKVVPANLEHLGRHRRRLRHHHRPDTVAGLVTDPNDRPEKRGGTAD